MPCHPGYKALRQPPARTVAFTAKDGRICTAGLFPLLSAGRKNAVATVIHVHGNAGNMSAHWPLVSWLPERNVNLFMFDYRGFGESEAPITRRATDDTKSAIDYVCGIAPTLTPSA